MFKQSITACDLLILSPDQETLVRIRLILNEYMIKFGNVVQGIYNKDGITPVSIIPIDFSSLSKKDRDRMFDAIQNLVTKSSRVFAVTDED